MSDESPESDIRKRAAWLLGMLALVAVLFAALMITFIGSGNGKKAPQGLDDDPITQTSASPSITPKRSHTAPPPTAGGSGPSSGPSTGSSSTHHGSTSCPTSAVCALDGDPGDAVAAVNAYRTAHGQSAVTGAVSKAAQTCALNNGNGCTGGWSETYGLAQPDGAAAVQKILQFAKLLDPQLKSVEVGWAYDPAGKDYRFALIRND